MLVSVARKGPHAYTALFASALARVKSRFRHPNAKVVVWVQDLYSLGITETGQASGALARMMKSIEERVLRRASGVVVIHDRFRRYVVNQLSVKAARVTVVRNWSHVQSQLIVDRESARVRLDWRPSETIVLHAGNMGSKQALENVVDSARLAATNGAPVRFVLLGDGNQRVAIQELAVGLRTVEFIDPLPGDEFTDVLQCADILLVNERVGVAEMSVPSKLTTYYSTGLPVLAATDEGSITAEEISASGGGIRVDAGDPEALLAAVLTLRDDPVLGKELGSAGRRFRDRTLSEEAAIDNYDAWLGQLASA